MGKKKIAIIGDGAVGMFLYCRLFKNQDNEITLYAEKETINKNLKERQITLISSEKNHETHNNVKIKPTEELDQDTDLIIISVKTYHIDNLIKQIKDIIKPHSKIISIMNGMGYQEKLALLIDENGSYWCGVNTYGITRLDDRVIKHEGGEHIIMGNYKGVNKKDMENLIKDIFNGSTLNIKFSDDIKYEMWKKLAINAFINPITSILQIRNGELKNIESYNNFASNFANEIVKAAKLDNVSIDKEDYINELSNVIDKTANNKSSMLQDIENDRETEINHINGFIITICDRKGIFRKYNLLLFSIMITIVISGKNKKEDHMKELIKGIMKMEF